MPVPSSRRIRTALWLATAALIAPLTLTLTELGGGGARAWLRLGSLILIGSGLVVLLIQQRTFERRVAAQARADEALRLSEAKFSGILAIAADAIITVDQNQSIVHFNHGAEEIFGYRAVDVIGRELALLLPPRYRSVHDKHIGAFARSVENARRMGERREIFGIRSDGTEFPAEASISKLVQPDGVLFTVVLRDITERKRIEEDERFMMDASTLLSHSLDVDSVLQAIADVGVPRLADAAFVDAIEPDGELRRVASTSERQTLTPALRQLAAHPITADSPSPVVDVLRRRRLEHVPTVDAEWLEANEDPGAMAAWQSLGAHSLLIVPLVVGDRAIGAVTLVLVDPQRAFSGERIVLATKLAGTAATALENARLYALAQRANRSREEVLGVVSHDLRNPLSAIVMCARTLEENPPADESGRRSLVTTIRESAAWTNHLIQDLVDVSSLEQGQLSIERRPVDPAQLVLQTRHMFEMEVVQHQIELRQEVPTNLPLISADSTRVIQVLSNLLRNAIKFTPNGGRITVSVRAEHMDVVFAVRDSGPGVAPENRGRVFDRYWQSSQGARARGTGLGLSIAKGIAEAHGGRIWLESSPGSGATFSFSIPVVRSDGKPTGG